MASPPHSPKIPAAALRIYEQQFITWPLHAALSELHDQLKATGNTQARFQRDHHHPSPSSKTPELSWGRESPQLTLTPSPSPSPTLSPTTASCGLLYFPTPPESSPAHNDPKFVAPKKGRAKPRRLFRDSSPQTSPPPTHTMLRRSRARKSKARERRFWELDASGRRARRIAGG